MGEKYKIYSKATTRKKLPQADAYAEAVHTKEKDTDLSGTTSCRTKERIGNGSK